MTRGQFVTVLTLGAAGAIGLAGVALGVATYFSPRVYSAFAFVISGAVPAGWLAAMIAGGGVAAAVWLVKAQQATAAWLVRREMSKLHGLYREVEMALGTERANEFMRYKTAALANEIGGDKAAIFPHEAETGKLLAGHCESTPA